MFAEQGLGINDICRQLQVSRSTAYRYLKL
jgi:DNA-binding IclR family transcriptional regulator